MFGDFSWLDVTNWQINNHFQKLRVRFFGMVRPAFDWMPSFISSCVDGWISLMTLDPKFTYSHSSLPPIYSFWANSNASKTSFWEIGGHSKDAVMPGHNITVLNASKGGDINLDKFTMST